MRGLDLPEHVKEQLIALTPETYTGLATPLANLVDIP